jgi:hypothetical protein
LDRVPAYAAVDEAVRHARESGGEGAAKLVNAILRNLLRKPPLPPGAGVREGWEGPPLAKGLFRPRPQVATREASGRRGEGRAARSRRPPGYLTRTKSRSRIRRGR